MTKEKHDDAEHEPGAEWVNDFRGDRSLVGRVLPGTMSYGASDARHS